MLAPEIAFPRPLDEISVGQILASADLPSFAADVCEAHLGKIGIGLPDLREGFSFLQARIEAFNARSSRVWALRSVAAAVVARAPLTAGALTAASLASPAVAAGGECIPPEHASFSALALICVSYWIGYAMRASRS